MNKFKPIPQSELDAMKAREDAATEGPWEARHLAVYDDPLIIEGGEGRTAEMHGMPAQVLRIWRDEQNRRCTQFLADVHQTRGRRDGQSDDDADFIAHARHDQTYLREGYQALLAEYETQQDGLRSLWSLIENGELVRDISHDHESDWAVKSMNLVSTLQKVQALLGKKEPGE